MGIRLEDCERGCVYVWLYGFHRIYTGSPQTSCKFLRLNCYFLDFSQCFRLFWTIQNGRFFILVLFGHLIEKKVEKSHSPKRLNFRVGSNLHTFWFPFFLFLSITFFKIIQIQNVWEVSENSGNLQQDEHKNFQNWWRNAWDNWTQSWQPQKFNQPKLS